MIMYYCMGGSPGTIMPRVWVGMSAAHMCQIGLNPHATTVELVHARNLAESIRRYGMRTSKQLHENFRAGVCSLAPLPKLAGYLLGTFTGDEFVTALPAFLAEALMSIIERDYLSDEKYAASIASWLAPDVGVAHIPAYDIHATHPLEYSDPPKVDAVLAADWLDRIVASNLLPVAHYRARIEGLLSIVATDTMAVGLDDHFAAYGGFAVAVAHFLILRVRRARYVWNADVKEHIPLAVDERLKLFKRVVEDQSSKLHSMLQARSDAARALAESALRDALLEPTLPVPTVLAEHTSGKVGSLGHRMSRPQAMQGVIDLRASLDRNRFLQALRETIEGTWTTEHPSALARHLHLAMEHLPESEHADVHRTVLMRATCQRESPPNRHGHTKTLQSVLPVDYTDSYGEQRVSNVMARCGPYSAVDKVCACVDKMASVRAFVDRNSERISATMLSLLKDANNLERVGRECGLAV